MQRVIKLSKFRNFGLENEETLILNQSLSKGEMGDLVIVIGPNNSGKSNILDAISLLQEDRALSDRDITTLSLDEEHRKPHVSLGIRSRADEISIYYRKGLGETTCNVSLPQEPASYNFEKAKDDFLKLSTRVAEKNYHFSDIASRYQDECSQGQRLDEAAFRSFLTRYLEELKDQATRWGLIRYSNDALRNLTELSEFTKNIITDVYFSEDKYVMANNYVSKHCGMPLLPKIFRYEEKPITSRDMYVESKDFANSSFFHSLFKAIGIDPQEVVNAYGQFQKFHNPATLTKIKKRINNATDKINEQFNKMYFAEQDEYKFTIELESQTISFGMARGESEDPIMIEYQSTGFRWFFNLYFNFLCSNQLKPGDIVIMDEPATHLHPQGQKELRKFIKEFAVKNDLTFVIATHSPFLIDPDNYDELRVVSTKDNRSHIDNLFTAVNMDDPDSLMPIKESLTVKQNVFYEFETEVIWVEGITDYCYLTMFKKLLDKENIAFIPFQGVGADDEEQRAIIKRLKNIPFFKRNMLVDGDKAGRAMKKNCKDTAFNDVVCISDVPTQGKSFVEIEDLFSTEDRRKFGLDKKASGATLMKKCCKLEDFSKETVDNFKALFALLLDE